MLTRTWMTPAGFVAGTLPYMSPEQADGVRDDPRVDVYAVGAVLYRMLTGQPYLDFDQRETPGAQADNVYRIRNEQPPPPSAHNRRVPAWLDGVVLKALAKQPEQRYAGAEELRAALLRQAPRAAAAGKTRLAGPPPPSPPAARQEKRALPPLFWPLLGGAVIVLVILVIAGAALLGGGDGDLASRSDTTRPDLVVARSKVELETGAGCDYASTQLGVRVVVENVGDASAGPFIVDVNGAQQQVPAGLAAGESASLWFEGYDASGENTIVVDAGFDVEERDEMDNRVSQRLPLPTLPPTCTPPAREAPGVPTPALAPTDTLPPPTFTPTPVPTDTPLPPTAIPTPAEPSPGETRTRAKDGMVMVYVPAGEFLMGSTDADGEAMTTKSPSTPSTWTPSGSTGPR